MQGPLMLMRGGFGELSALETIYAVAYPLAWLVPLTLWSLHAFRHFILAAEGAR
jgi:hypothetical protein